jgi:hypothetical protein
VSLIADFGDGRTITNRNPSRPACDNKPVDILAAAQNGRVAVFQGPVERVGSLQGTSESFVHGSTEPNKDADHSSTHKITDCNYVNCITLCVEACVAICATRY